MTKQFFIMLTAIIISIFVSGYIVFTETPAQSTTGNSISFVQIP